MDRDFIIVLGNQGEGKSVWAKLYAKSKTRLLVFDPLCSYDRVDFQSDPTKWVETVVSNSASHFRYGTYLPDDLPMFGDAAFAAGDCTFLIEECAWIFRRGEELHDWAKPLVFTGRFRRVNLLLIAQRAAKIPLDIRSQASRIITFKQTEPTDVDALIDRLGEAGEEIPELPKLTCLDWKGGQVSRYSVNP